MPAWQHPFAVRAGFTQRGFRQQSGKIRSIESPELDRLTSLDGHFKYGWMCMQVVQCYATLAKAKLLSLLARSHRRQTNTHFCLTKAVVCTRQFFHGITDLQVPYSSWSLSSVPATYSPT